MTNSYHDCSTSHTEKRGNTADLESFEAYRTRFAYSGDKLFHWLFEHNQQRIKSKKVEVAANNLKKIFAATFKLSAKTGFHEMSLRDLSQETGISMGGLYSCLSKKEDIALMVLDIVELVTSENNHAAQQHQDVASQLVTGIQHHLYASTLLQPWFFFLYFETRCLSTENQLRSKAIETQTIALFEQMLTRGVDQGQFNVDSPYFVAQAILSVLQDWYLKPWKSKEKQIDLNTYSRHLLLMVKRLLNLGEVSQTLNP